MARKQPTYQLTRTRTDGKKHTVTATGPFRVEQHIAFCAELNLGLTRPQASSCAREAYRLLATGQPYTLGPYTYTLTPTPSNHRLC